MQSRAEFSGDSQGFRGVLLGVGRGAPFSGRGGSWDDGRVVRSVERLRGPAVSTQRFVRPARAGDVEAIVDVQVAAWREMYREVLPGAVLAELSGQEARAEFVARWRAAVSSPPTSRHRLLVATDEGEVAGFAAMGPAQDPDRWPGTDAEIYALHVAPGFARRGHGSRLLHAVVDHLLDDGFQAVYVWALERDNVLRSFVERAGWAADGARRELDLGVVVPMVRLHAAISR